MLRRHLFTGLLGAIASLLLFDSTAHGGIFDPPPSIGVTGPQFNANFAPYNLFTASVTESDIGVTAYGQNANNVEWAGVGPGPHTIFIDYGTELTGVDGIAYAQRWAPQDAVGNIEFWFSNTPFEGVPLTPADVTVPIHNRANSILTQYSFGGLAFDGQYIAARFNAAVAGNIGGSEFRLTFDTPLYSNPTFIVNRDTGNISLVNETREAFTFIAYELDSPTVGGLDASQWNSITSNNPGWIELSPAPFIGTLGESQLPGGSGLTLNDKGTIDLGNVWIPTPTEDLTIRLVGTDGSLMPADVIYVGDELVVGDYSGNGQVGPEDWPLFRAGLGSVGTGLSPAQTYQFGDLNADGDVDLSDFRAFRTIYDANNGAGAFAALVSTNSAVPEPMSAMLAIGLTAAVVIGRGGRSLSRVSGAGKLWALLLTALFLVHTPPATAQTFTITNPATPISSFANSVYPGGAYAVANLFNDAALTDADIGMKAYVGDVAGTQYAGVGIGDKEVFFNYDSSVSANYIAYAQRAGSDPNADKVGRIDLWFSNTDFENVIPDRAPDAIVSVTDITGRITPYSLGGLMSGQYVAARLSVHDVSRNSPNNNIGGNELRLVTGPSEVLLEVNRTTGELKIRNQGSLSQELQINGYEIRSDGSLLNSWSGFADGIVSGFTPGSGAGDGWEKGLSSNSNQLVETYLLGSSTLTTEAVLPLGVGYDTSVDAQDLEFYVSITSGLGLFMPGRVVYVGGGETLLGDYNNDGFVDLADYTVWRNNLGQVSLPNEDETVSPGVVDAADYQVWKDNFGQSLNGALVTSPQNVPEPGSLLLLAMGGVLCCGRRLWRGAQHLACLLVALAGYGTLAHAATPDAIYLFGDNSAETTENGSAGVEVGQAFGAVLAGYTFDHYGDLTSPTTFRDLAPVPDVLGSRPKYVDTGALNYPGTNLGAGISSGNIGIAFDGIDDALTGIALGYPPNGDDVFEATGPYANAYGGITTRLIDGWVRPSNLSGTRQDIVNDSTSYGIHITENNTWGVTFLNVAFDSGVSVADSLDENGWAHVQHIATDFRAQLLVNGVVEFMTPKGVYVGTPGAEIVFGASRQNAESNYENFFTGTLDNFRLSVSGGSYGPINILTDNDFIAAYGIVPGDANGDGMVLGDGTGHESTDDVTYFINRYKATQVIQDAAGVPVVVGDLNSITTMADFDGNGRTDILDWIILYQNHQNPAALANADLAALLGSSHAVPEPTTLACLALALLGWGTTGTLRRRSS